MAPHRDGVGGGGAEYFGYCFQNRVGRGRKAEQNSSPPLHPLSLPFPLCKVETTVLPATKVESKSQEVIGLRGQPGTWVPGTA